MTDSAASSVKYIPRVNGALGVFIAVHVFLPSPWLSAALAAMVWLVFSCPMLTEPRPANLLTAFRLALALGAFVALGWQFIGWQAFTALLGLALALDGVDGWLARRTGPTLMGGLFDMECDNVWLAVVWLALYGQVAEAEPVIRLLVGCGLIIPCYRLGIVAIQALQPLAPRPKTGVADTPQQAAGRGRAWARGLFVAVAALALLALWAQGSGHTTLLVAATLAALGCSSYSFWPEYRARF